MLCGFIDDHREVGISSNGSNQRTSSVCAELLEGSDIMFFVAAAVGCSSKFCLVARITIIHALFAFD